MVILHFVLHENINSSRSNTMLETTYLIHKMGSGLVKDISSSERPKDASRPYRIYHSSMLTVAGFLNIHHAINQTMSVSMKMPLVSGLLLSLWAQTVPLFDFGMVCLKSSTSGHKPYGKCQSKTRETSSILRSIFPVSTIGFLISWWTLRSDLQSTVSDSAQRRSQSHLTNHYSGD